VGEEEGGGDGNESGAAAREEEGGGGRRRRRRAVAGVGAGTEFLYHACSTTKYHRPLKLCQLYAPQTRFPYASLLLKFSGYPETSRKTEKQQDFRYERNGRPLIGRKDITENQ
jgi:hypothetical protein